MVVREVGKHDVQSEEQGALLVEEERAADSVAQILYQKGELLFFSFIGKKGLILI